MEEDTASVTGAGTASFSPITYEKAGIYKYTIQEVAGETAGFQYDQTVYNVTVTVTDEGAKLIADVKYTVEGENRTELSVKNIYEPQNASAKIQAMTSISHCMRL